MWYSVCQLYQLEGRCHTCGTNVPPRRWERNDDDDEENEEEEEMNEETERATTLQVLQCIINFLTITSTFTA